MLENFPWANDELDLNSIHIALASLHQAPQRPAPYSLYGIACVGAMRTARDEVKVADSRLWANLLAAIKAPGSWERREPMFLKMAHSSAHNAVCLNAILDRGQCGLSLATIGPIGAPGARALGGAGIFTSEDLLTQASTPESRAALATATQLDADKLVAWARLAELSVTLELAQPDFAGPTNGGLVTLADLATIADVKTMATISVPVVAVAMSSANRDRMRVVDASLDSLTKILTAWKDAASKWVCNVGDGSGSMVRPPPPKPPADDSNLTGAHKHESAANDTEAAQAP